MTGPMLEGLSHLINPCISSLFWSDCFFVDHFDEVIRSVVDDDRKLRVVRGICFLEIDDLIRFPREFSGTRSAAGGDDDIIE